MSEMQRPLLIYVLGSSYSGSSLLGYLLHRYKNLYNVGELKYFNRVQSMSVTCSCGDRVSKCSFWGSIYSHNYYVFEQPALIRKITFALLVLLPWYRKIPKFVQKDDLELLHTLRSHIHSTTESDQPLIVDTSKSIWRLSHLLVLRGIDIKVLYLVRQPEGNIASFIKHGFSFCAALFIYFSNKLLCERYLEKFEVPHYRMSYESLCDDPMIEVERFGAYIGDESLVQGIYKTDYLCHSPAGNQGTLDQLLKEEAIAIKKDDSWRALLEPWKVKVISWFK